MASLQEQYNLIKEGKGAKDVFLKHAKALFPHLIPNHYGFELTSQILKQKAILTEGYVDLQPLNDMTARPKENWENSFAKFLKEEEEKKVKADLKKTDKSVEDVQENNFDYKDTKNADNVIWDQYQRGIYTEMSKDINQDLEAVKKKVLKNLASDPIYYTKNSAFGLEIEGYTDKLPGANPPKSDKMEVISKEKAKANVQDSLGKKEAASKGMPKAVKSEMTVTPKNSKGVKKMDMPGVEKKIKLKEDTYTIKGKSLLELLSEDEFLEEGAMDDQIAASEKKVDQKKLELAAAEKEVATKKEQEAKASQAG